MKRSAALISASDRLEARALERLFEPGARPAITALKGALGESQASGGIRSAAMALSIHAGCMAPTRGLSTPILALDVVRGKPRHMTVNHGLVNACASGGTFVSVVLKKGS